MRRDTKGLLISILIIGIFVSGIMIGQYFKPVPIDDGNFGEVQFSIPNEVRVVLIRSGTTEIDYSLIAKGWQLYKIDAEGVHYVQVGKNIVVNQGVYWLNTAVYDTGSMSPAKYIGWAGAQFTPAYTDTTAQYLITNNGLEPQAGTVSHGTPSNGDIQTTIEKTFTATGTVSVYVMFLMTGTTSDKLYAEIDIVDATLYSGDKIVATWFCNTQN